MKIFKNMIEISSLLRTPQEEVFLEIRSLYTTDGLGTYQTFMSALGGDIYLLENVEELSAIETSAEGPDGSYLSILDTSDFFDSCHYLPSLKFVMIVIVTSDAGGNAYFVPEHIANMCPNVALSVSNSNPAESVVKSFRGPLQQVSRISPMTGVTETRSIPISDNGLEAIAMRTAEAFKHKTFLTKDELQFIQNGL